MHSNLPSLLEVWPALQLLQGSLAFQQSMRMAPIPSCPSLPAARAAGCGTTSAVCRLRGWALPTARLLHLMRLLGPLCMAAQGSASLWLEGLAQLPVVLHTVVLQTSRGRQLMGQLVQVPKGSKKSSQQRSPPWPFTKGAFTKGACGSQFVSRQSGGRESVGQGGLVEVVTSPDCKGAAARQQAQL